MGAAGGLVSPPDPVPAPPGELPPAVSVGPIALLDPAPAPPGALLDEPGIWDGTIALLPAPPMEKEIGVGPTFGGPDMEIEPTVIGGKEKAGPPIVAQK